jgi:hypothetical protein
MPERCDRASSKVIFRVAQSFSKTKSSGIKLATGVSQETGHAVALLNWIAIDVAAPVNALVVLHVGNSEWVVIIRDVGG